MNTIIKISLISLFLILTACSGTPDKLDNAPLISQQVDSQQRPLVKARLDQFYKDFAGTKYRYGGLTSHGMDCSGVAYKTYREYLGWDIPRSTELQLTQGKAIPQSQLQAGDLVFFTPENKGMHVGIYYDNANGGRFLHVSTSQGVILSHMKSTYWAQFYKESRRVY